MAIVDLEVDASSAIAGTARLAMMLEGGSRVVTTALTEAMLNAVKWRTALPFQSVPSYLFESGWPSRYPGRKKYPSGTKATFARTSPPLRQPWYSQVQFYAEGTHALHNTLDMNVKELYKRHGFTGTFEGQVGYPQGIGGTVTRIIYLVMDGTKKMQGRPYLKNTLAQARKPFLRSMINMVRGVVQYYPTIRDLKPRIEKTEVLQTDGRRYTKSIFYPQKAPKQLTAVPGPRMRTYGSTEDIRELGYAAVGDMSELGRLDTLESFGLHISEKP